MNPVQPIITAYYTTAAILALGALTAAILCSFFLIVRGRTASSGPTPVKNPDAILMLLSGIEHVVHFLAKAAGTLGKWAVRGLALGAGLGVTFAGLLFLTARGLETQETWARTSAGVICGVFLLMSAFASLATRGIIRFGPLLVLAGSGRAIWILWSF